MDQLQEIIQLLSSGDSGVTNALLKTKILLFSIGRKELATWVNHELNGYPDDAILPEYRIVTTRILADLNNGVRHYPAFPLPLGYLNDEDYLEATQSQIVLSISQIETLVVNAEDHQNLQQPIPLDFAYIKYCKKIERGYELTRCYKEIALHNFVSILTQVRSRLLDFVLELTDQLAGIPGEKPMTEKLKTIDTPSLFRNSIFGNNTIINFGNENSFIVNNNTEKNDINALKQTLTENGIEQDDIHDLEIAIDNDGPIASRNGEYGQSVSAWFAKMVNKAAQGTMSIGINVFTQIATAALKKYYDIE
ncbi:hypothetical protein PGO05_10440 [Klebsiella aerogenes]